MIGFSQMNYGNGIKLCVRGGEGTGLAICVLFALLASSCSSRPVEEIVTTDARRVSALPAGEPVTKEANLPKRDPDLEKAGDRIGEALTYLQSRRRDKGEAAIRALNQAQVSLVRLQRESGDTEPSQTQLRDLLKDLDSSVRAISKNAPDASKHLADLSKRIDSLEITLPEDAERESK
jgi:chromosome segregation ATPase